jgi:quercetin dioxygenase-like cupin family protein
LKALIRVSPLVLAALLLSAAVGVAMDSKAVVWPAGDIQWKENPNMKGAWSATLWGDPTKGAYGTLRKVAAGTDLGKHSHSFDQKVVAVAGTFEFTIEGQPMKELPPGSYILTPAHVKHTSKCKDGAECIYFEEQPGKADFIPAK